MRDLANGAVAAFLASAIDNLARAEQVAEKVNAKNLLQEIGRVRRQIAGLNSLLDKPPFLSGAA